MPRHRDDPVASRSRQRRLDAAGAGSSSPSPYDRQMRAAYPKLPGESNIDYQTRLGQIAERESERIDQINAEQASPPELALNMMSPETRQALADGTHATSDVTHDASILRRHIAGEGGPGDHSARAAEIKSWSRPRRTAAHAEIERQDHQIEREQIALARSGSLPPVVRSSPIDLVRLHAQNAAEWVEVHEARLVALEEDAGKASDRAAAAQDEADTALQRVVIEAEKLTVSRANLERYTRELAVAETKAAEQLDMAAFYDGAVSDALEATKE